MIQCGWGIRPPWNWKPVYFAVNRTEDYCQHSVKKQSHFIVLPQPIWAMPFRISFKTHSSKSNNCTSSHWWEPRSAWSLPIKRKRKQNNLRQAIKASNDDNIDIIKAAAFFIVADDIMIREVAAERKRRHTEADISSLCRLGELVCYCLCVCLGDWL